MGAGAKGTGLSPEDWQFIQQALGQNLGMMHNRYSQLGLGDPNPNVFGGDPATAAKAGGSLQYGSPGTAELADLTGLRTQAGAALGQLQTQNAQNPAVQGSAANIAQGNQSLASLIGQNQFNQGAQSRAGNPSG